MVTLLEPGGRWGTDMVMCWALTAWASITPHVVSTPTDKSADARSTRGPTIIFTTPGANSDAPLKTRFQMSIPSPTSRNQNTAASQVYEISVTGQASQ